MSNAPRTVQAGVGIALSVTALMACADDSGSAASPPQWDACRLLDVEGVVEVFGVTDASALTMSRGLSDVDWGPPQAEAASQHRVAISRCSYGLVGDAAGGHSLDLVTRVTGLPDRSQSRTRALLQTQGFSPTDVELECSEGALWVPGELHAFTTVPSKSPPEKCRGVGGDSPLYAHAVLRIDVGRNDESTRRAATKLIQTALPTLRDEMAALHADHPEVEVPSAPGDRPDAGTVIAASEFAVIAAHLQCERVEQCCGAEAGGPVAAVVNDPATCMALLGAAYSSALLGAVDAVERGALSYSSSEAAACFEDFARASCDDLVMGTATAPCLSAFAGRAELGDPCISDFECVSDYCEQEIEVRLLSDGGAAVMSHDAGAASTNDASTIDASIPIVDGGAGDSAAPRALSTGRCSERAEEGAACDSDSACVTGRCEGGSCIAHTPTPWCQGI